MDGDFITSNTTKCLFQLCAAITRKNNESVVPYYKLAVQIISCADLTQTYGDKEFIAIIETVKRKFSNEKEVLKFHELCLILKKNKFLKYPGAILSLLLNISSLTFDESRFLNLKLDAFDHLLNEQNGFSSDFNEDFNMCLAINIPTLCHDTEIKKRNFSQKANSFNKNQKSFPIVPPLSTLQDTSFIKNFKNSFSQNDQYTVSQTQFIRELLLLFQGIQGQHIVYETTREEFRINSKIKVSAPNKQLLLRLAEVGWLFQKVKYFCDSHQSLNESLMVQSLVSALTDYITEYYRLLAILECQLEQNHLTLRQLQVWMLDPLKKFKMLAALLDNCHEVKGGALTSKIYIFMQHGDPQLNSLMRQLLARVCQPLIKIILKWITEGELNDVHNEFFIADDQSIREDHWWKDRYRLRVSMLPSFLTLSHAQKIQAVGKNINFLRHICHSQQDSMILSSVPSVDKAVESILEDQTYFVQYVVNAPFQRTSSQVLHILVHEYKLLDHLRAIRRYLLLGQGDFIAHLLQLLEPELSNPVKNLHPHNLSSILEAAVRNTNAQFDDKDILTRLDVRMLQPSPGDTGWDVFTLDYRVDGPISVMFNADCMNKYLMLFNILWKVKRMEFTLLHCWRQEIRGCKLLCHIPEASSLLHSMHLLTSEMVHFAHQMSYYMTFEVIECQFVILENQLLSVVSLDQLLNVHSDFLKVVLNRMLLEKPFQKLLSQLRAIYDLILQFDTLQSKSIEYVSKEIEEQNKNAELEKRQSTKLISIAVEESDQSEKQKYNNKITNFLYHSRAQLNVLKHSYQEMVHSFLLMLASHPDVSLQWLSFRLDFNEHYKKKDRRLQVPLTYQQRRLSEHGFVGISSDSC